jgi:hypothetical protein
MTGIITTRLIASGNESNHRSGLGGFLGQPVRLTRLQRMDCISADKPPAIGKASVNGAATYMPLYEQGRGLV